MMHHLSVNVFDNNFFMEGLVYDDCDPYLFHRGCNFLQVLELSKSIEVPQRKLLVPQTFGNMDVSRAFNENASEESE